LVVVQLDVMTRKEQNEILLLIDMGDGWSYLGGFVNGKHRRLSTEEQR